MLYDDEEAVYETFKDLLQATENGEIDPSEVTIRIDNDYAMAVIEDPDIDKIENMNTVPPEEDVQWLVDSEKLPRYILLDVLNTLGFNAENV